MNAKVNQLLQRIFDWCDDHDRAVELAVSASENAAKRHAQYSPLVAQAQDAMRAGDIAILNAELAPAQNEALHACQRARKIAECITTAWDRIARLEEQTPGSGFNDARRRRLVARLAEVDQRQAAVAQLEQHLQRD